MCITLQAMIANYSDLYVIRTVNDNRQPVYNTVQIKPTLPHTRTSYCPNMVIFFFSAI